MTDAILVQTTVPDEDKGRELARLLVEARLAACAKVSSSCLSIYRWEGNVIDDRESVLTIVSKQALYPALEEKASGLIILTKYRKSSPCRSSREAPIIWTGSRPKRIDARRPHFPLTSFLRTAILRAARWAC